MYNKKGEDHIVLINYCTTLNRILKGRFSHREEHEYLMFLNNFSVKFNYDYLNLFFEYGFLRNPDRLEKFVLEIEAIAEELGKRPFSGLTLRGFKEGSIRKSDTTENDYEFIPGTVYFNRCRGCNRLFITLNSTQRYCMPFCKQESANKKRRALKIKRKCPICGMVFQGTKRKRTCGKAVCKKRDYLSRIYQKREIT